MAQQHRTAFRPTPRRPCKPPPHINARLSQHPTRRSRSAEHPPGCPACAARVFRSTRRSQFMQEAVVFASQIPSGTRADRAAFRRFLAGIRIQRRRLTSDDHAMPRHHATKQAALDRKKPASPARATGPQPSPRPHPQAPGPHAGSSETRRIGQYACLPPCVRRDRHP
jgi:hypothetical protein